MRDDLPHILLAEFAGGGILSEVESVLRRHSEIRVLRAPDGAQPIALDAALRQKPDQVLLALDSETLDQGRAFLKAVRGELPEARVLVLIDSPDSNAVLELLQLGAADFIVPPVRHVDLMARVRRFLRPRDSSGDLIRNLKVRQGLEQLVGQSRQFRELMSRIPLVASCDVTTMIVGETGTGKELCARAIHYLSARSGKPFLCVNCGGPESP